MNIFQQHMISSCTHDNLCKMIKVLHVLIILSILIWFKFRYNASAILITTLPIKMSRNYSKLNWGRENSICILGFLLLKQSLLCCNQTPTSHVSNITSITNPNSLNDLVFIDNYLIPIGNNDINNINEHKNNNNVTIHVSYFSVSSIGSNPMTHNNNIPIEIVNTMEETYFMPMRKII